MGYKLLKPIANLVSLFRKIRTGALVLVSAPVKIASGDAIKTEKKEDKCEIVLASSTGDGEAKFVELMRLDKECYFWGNSGDCGSIEEPEFFAIDNNGLLYSIYPECGQAYQESDGYVWVMDYDGNQIDFDPVKAELFEDVTIYE